MTEVVAQGAAKGRKPLDGLNFHIGLHGDGATDQAACAEAGITRTVHFILDPALVGARLTSAREALGMAQSAAALAVGYVAGAQLSQIEYATRLPPLVTLIRASALYGVSTDYLLGLSDEAEPDSRSANRASAMRAVRGPIDGLADAVLELFAEAMAPLSPEGRAWEHVKPLIQRVLSAFDLVHSRNRELFDNEFRGGASLVSAVAALRSALAAVEA